MTYTIIIIISFRYVFEKLIIITREDVSDLNMFRITSIIKIEIAFVMISKSFKFDIVDLGETIDEICEITFMKNDFSKR